jgi:hypothetical protein
VREVDGAMATDLKNGSADFERGRDRADECGVGQRIQRGVPTIEHVRDPHGGEAGALDVPDRLSGDGGDRCGICRKQLWYRYADLQPASFIGRFFLGRRR